jgi:hypothetical protein
MIVLLVNMISYTLWVVHRRCVCIIGLRYNCSKFWLPIYECAIIGVTIIETTSKMVLAEFVYIKVYRDTHNHTMQDYGMQVVDYLKLCSSQVYIQSP